MPVFPVLKINGLWNPVSFFKAAYLLTFAIKGLSQCPSPLPSPSKFYHCVNGDGYFDGQNEYIVN